MITFEVAYTPASVASDAAPRVYVLIDVLRATSAIVSMLGGGARSVVLAGSDAAAKVAMARVGNALLCAENADGSIAHGADISPSLNALRAAELGNRNIVLRSTNGTVAACGVADRPGVGLVGALVNAAAVMRSAIDLAARADAPVCLVCSGREAATVCCLDDAYCAGYLVNEGMRQQSASGRAARLRDSAKIALCLFEKYATPVDALGASESAGVLRRIGSDADIAFAATVNTIGIAPKFKTIGGFGLVEVRNPADAPAEAASFNERQV